MPRHIRSVTVLTALTALLVVPAHAEECIGDLNLDRRVDAADLGLVFSAWGACRGSCPADLDGDQAVDASDLGLLIGRWGECPDDPGTGPYDYAQVLQKAITFYDAQRAGTYAGRLT